MKGLADAALLAALAIRSVLGASALAASRMAAPVTGRGHLAMAGASA